MSKFFFILISLFLLCVHSAYATEIDRKRMQNIAQHVIKMQTLDDPDFKKTYLKLAELMVGNATDKHAIEMFMTPVLHEGIANYLRRINSQGLNPIQTKAMNRVIENEIKATSALFRSCHIIADIRTIEENVYAVPIRCLSPFPDNKLQNEFLSTEFAIPKTDPVLFKIEYLKAKQFFLAKAVIQPLDSELYIYVEKNNVYRAAIEEDEHFPNVVISHRDEALENISKSAPAE